MRPDEDLNEQCANMAEEDYEGELPDDKDIRVETMGLPVGQTSWRMPCESLCKQ